MKLALLKGIAVIAVIIAIIATFILTNRHIEIFSGDPLSKSACSAFGKVDCDTALSSSFSEIFSIPMSIYGGIFYFIICSFILLNLFFPNFLKTYGYQFAFWLSCIGLVCNIYFAYILFVLHTFCPFCVLSYVMDLIILIVLYVLLIEYDINPLKKIKNYLTIIKEQERVIITFIISTLCLIALIVISLFWYIYKITPHATIKEITSYLASQQRYVIPISDDMPRKGDPNAPIQIVIFSEFECPHCKIGEVYLDIALKPYKDKSVLYFKHLPLDNECNPDIKLPFHKVACIGSYASYCAQLKGFFWDFSQELFRSQDKWTEDDLVYIGESFGIEPVFMRKCINDPMTKSKIEKDINDAKRFKVEATPTYFVNGFMISGAQKPKFWQMIFEAVLKL